MGVWKIYNDKVFNPRESADRTVGAESINSRCHAVLGVSPGDKTALGWEVGKSLNVQDLLMSKASMSSEWRKNEDD